MEVGMADAAEEDSICTSFYVGSRRGMADEASDDVSLAAEYTFTWYMAGYLIDGLNIRN
jgi:hypothetical protein